MSPADSSVSVVRTYTARLLHLLLRELVPASLEIRLDLVPSGDKAETEYPDPITGESAGLKIGTGLPASGPTVVLQIPDEIVLQTGEQLVTALPLGILPPVARRRGHVHVEPVRHEPVDFEHGAEVVVLHNPIDDIDGVVPVALLAELEVTRADHCLLPIRSLGTREVDLERAHPTVLRADGLHPHKSIGREQRVDVVVDNSIYPQGYGLRGSDGRVYCRGRMEAEP